MAMPIDWGRTASVGGPDPWRPSRSAPTTSVQSIRLGFLGDRPFRYGNHLFGLLDFLGFPWILSSESSLFNGYAGFSLDHFSSRFFPINFPH
jgi:hypothetical protein